VQGSIVWRCLADKGDAFAHLVRRNIKALFYWQGSLIFQDRKTFLCLCRKRGSGAGESAFRGLSDDLMDVHLKERRIEIPQDEKTGVGCVVYLSEDAQAALNAWMKVGNCQKVFLVHALGERKDKMTFGRLVC